MKRYLVTIHVLSALVRVEVAAFDAAGAKRAAVELFDARGAWVEAEEIEE